LHLPEGNVNEKRNSSFRLANIRPGMSSSLAMMEEDDIVSILYQEHAFKIINILCIHNLTLKNLK
jgi:hypothetical protein